MSDLIKQLRYAAQGELFGDTLLEEAADRIEQLEAKLARSDRKEIEAVYRKLGELEAQAELDKAEINAAFNNAEMFADRIAALEAENNELQAWVDSYREHGTRVLNANKEEIDTLEAKLDATHNWVLNTCPEEYNQFVKALGEAK